MIRTVGRAMEEWVTERVKIEFRGGKSSQWLNTAEGEMTGFGLPTICSHFRTFSLQGRNWKADFSRRKRIQWMSKWNRMSYWWNYKLSLILRETKPSLTQSCPTLCNPVDCSPPRSSVHGIFQARVLEWVSISFSRGSSRPRDRTRVSRLVSRTLYRLSHQGSPNIKGNKTKLNNSDFS